tara:strand:+ start:4443 stop:5204 length:762 start_codon:yes stop_codon:yes gene_type:complete
MKILVTGKNGYVGKSIINKLKGYDITGVGRDDFDLTNKQETIDYFKGKHFDRVIHTANVGGSRLWRDNSDVLLQNLSMFTNLSSVFLNYDRLISFGSGAERNYPTDPYGLSKMAINKMIQNHHIFHNIRIFGVFDENEWDSRFIKSNIKRYIKKEPLIIHQNKFMDFIYMDDLIMLVDYIIKNPYEKLVEANYTQPYSLLDIALFINELSDYRCEIITKEDGMGEMYTGGVCKIKLPYIGMEKALKRMYEAIN